MSGLGGQAVGTGLSEGDLLLEEQEPHMTRRQGRVCGGRGAASSSLKAQLEAGFGLKIESPLSCFAPYPQ